MTDFREILRRYWGYPDFRGIQREIIESVAAGHDTLGLMPTGGGKSIAFQVPALAREGVCLVVTPLIALMKDQVANLCRRGIRAAAIYSGQTREEIQRHLDNALYGGYRFLYVSPERLATPLFLHKVRAMKVSLLTVDEAHCISQWGYDFRPHYLRIAEVRELLPDVPVLALTATATTRVVADICEKLAFRPGSRVFRMSFARENLRYVVRRAENKDDELLHVLRSVPGSAIVYTRSRNGTKELAARLQQEGIGALHYHAGLTSLDRDVRQRDWQEGRTRVMVATNAFGMGIDKPDVRLVLHYDLPDSLEAYFQEAGRAGRDGHTAYAVLLYNRADRLKLAHRVSETFPDKAYVARVYGDLASFFAIAEGEAEGRTYEFNIDHFCRVFHHFPVVLVGALNLLTQAGYIDFKEEDENSSRLLFLVSREELYHDFGLSTWEERVLNAVLRTYGGVFADYVSVDEADLARRCQLTPQQVYETLKLLTHHRIIHYVPTKHVPRITYLCRRLDVRYIELPPSVYDVRKAQYAERVGAMLSYAEEDDLCRSRFLLRYFDDEAPDCGHCDVCIARRAEGREPASRREAVDALKARYLALLADGQPHAADTLEGPPALRSQAFGELVEEGRVGMEGACYRLV